ncbi:MAG TPA: hypothetical protein VFN61_00990 [Acidimicrobiales bacterium]|nr:hypothetical protein [Acidimicrobiales bacterium]
MTETDDLLATTQEVLDHPSLWGASWARAVAFLARQALESAVSAVWVGPFAALVDASFTDQLIALGPALGDSDLAGQVRHTWHQLCAACHAHVYELAPTAQELRSLFDAVSEAIGKLAGCHPLSTPTS